jgi:hypothetical protein
VVTIAAELPCKVTSVDAFVGAAKWSAHFATVASNLAGEVEGPRSPCCPGGGASAVAQPVAVPLVVAIRWTPASFAMRPKTLVIAVLRIIMVAVHVRMTSCCPRFECTRGLPLGRRS